MKNNSEIVNNTMCKSCLREHKEMTGQEPIDCAFKAFDNEYCEEAQELADYITNQDTKWQKLKEWLEEQQNNFKLISKTLGKADYVLLSNCIKSVLSEMAKLEGEDER